MNKKIIAICLIIVMATAFALGLTGVLPMASAAGDTASEDRLIGVLVTREYLDLFDAEGYLNDHLGDLAHGGELDPVKTQSYQGRVYAQLEEQTSSSDTGETLTTYRYVFREPQGFALMAPLVTQEGVTYRTSGGDGAIADVRTDITETDTEGDTLRMEGTLYLATGTRGEFYVNPVYQTAAGEVYVTSGSGLLFNGDDPAGQTSIHTLSQETTVTLEGETRTARSEVQITVSFLDPPDRVTLLQFGPGGQLLASADYETLPETLTPAPGTAYIVAESASGASVTRALYGPEDGMLSAFALREDGICQKTWCTVLWGD